MRVKPQRQALVNVVYVVRSIIIFVIALLDVYVCIYICYVPMCTYMIPVHMSPVIYTYICLTGSSSNN